MNFNAFIAFLIVVCLAAWMIFGQMFAEKDEPTAEAAAEPAADPLPSVRYRISEAQPFQARVVLRGRTEPSRSTVLNAEVGGQVAEIVAERGSRVAAGEALVRLDPQDWPERLQAAEAEVALRQMQHAAAQQLESLGQESQTRLAEAKALLEQARAERAAMQLAVDRSVIRAPYDGVFNDRLVEVGGFVSIGDPVVEFLSLNPLVVESDATGRNIQSLRVGQPGTAVIDGVEYEGRIRYISRQADPNVRTYAVELEIPNPNQALAAGLTADIVAPTETVPAHRVSPALLSLSANTEGELGLKVLDEDNRVVFHKANILASADEGVWVGGLPERARIITVGQGFVKEGVEASGVEESTIE